MLYGITIILILLAVSGLIAYLGDYLGRRIGKKRVSVFGLRPKHTSILLTIVTGVMITFTTLAVILLVSTMARKSFFGLQKVEGEIKAAKQALVKKSVEYNSVQKKFDKKSSEYLKLQVKMAADLSDGREKLDGLMGEINVRQVELNGLKATNEKLRDGARALKGQIIALGGEKAKLTARNASLQKELAALGLKKEKLEREVSQIAVDLTDSQKVGLYGEVLYQRAQPLARFIVEPGIGKEDLKKNVEESVGALIDAATAKGAIRAQDSAMFQGIQADKVWNALSRSRDGLVIEAVSATNVFLKDGKGEPFYVELKAYENRVVFKRGETVSEGKAPAGSSEEEVKAGLARMISQVMELARKRGVLPDLQTYMVGSMSQARYIEALAALENKETDLDIELFAVNDTRISGKLQIDFRIK